MTTIYATLGFTPEKLLAAVASVPNVERVVFYTAHSPDTRQKSEHAAKEVEKVLRQLGVESKSVVLRSPWNFLEILRALLEDLGSRPVRDAVFNLTGGPKTMTVAATIVSILLGVPLVYFPEKEEIGRDPIRLPVLKLAYSSLLTDRQRVVLREISKRGGSVRNADLHRALRITPPSLEHHVRKLEELGMVHVSMMKEDRRHRIVEITEAGQLLLVAEEFVEP